MQVSEQSKIEMNSQQLVRRLEAIIDGGRHLPHGLTEIILGVKRLLSVFLPRLAVVGWMSFSIAGNVHAQPQVPEPPLPVDPRPLTQLVSEPEKAMLTSEHNPKKLIEAFLRVSDTHLQAAHNAIKVNNHAAAERELDIYNKAVAEAGREAFALRDGRRGVSKKLEQALYRQIKTLESIDRLFPAEREAFSDAALKHAKQLRVQALNEAFASGEVLKDPEGEKKPKSEPPQKEQPHNDSTRPPAAELQMSAALPRALLSRQALMLRYTDTTLGGPHASQIPGDYLTEEEDDHVREAQAPDARVKVFMKIADRRINAIIAPSAQPSENKDQKKADEEVREWGAVPKVARAELLRHYARAIAECMAKLEDAYERNRKSTALPKALSLLRDSTDKHLQTLRALEPEMKDEREMAALREAIDQAETANKGARGGLK